jgi:ABC-type lipoprotein release transport system permease subunit
MELALKYFFRYRRRYVFLFIALTFGFGIITFITSVKDEMYENIYQSAQSHYAGDIIVAGYDYDMARRFRLGNDIIGNTFKAIGNSGITAKHIVMRTSFGGNGRVYFNGAAVRLKYVIGVDWQNETEYFGGLDYRGKADFPPDEQTIILSAPVAELLNVRLGDSVILEVDTRYYQKNTGAFIVGGIVNDSTIFGYHKAYTSRKALNGLLLYDETECSSIGIYLQDRRQAEKNKIVLNNELAKLVQTGPLVRNRDELDWATALPWEGITVFTITIPVYLSEVSDLLGAINILTYFLYIMMLLIILLSAAVTYRLILRERSKEIGTMRVIGFYESDLRFVLMIETCFIGLLSLLFGFIFSWLLAKAAGFISFSWFPSFEIFLKNGRLSVRYLPVTLFVNISAAFCMLIAAVGVPAFRVSRDPLPQLLFGGSV